MNLMFGNSISMTSKSLDFLWAKQLTIAHNLSNVDTPGYKSKYVTFEDEYQNRLKLARAAGNASRTRSIIENSSYTINETESSARLDDNNVNADSEEVEMARAQLQYQYVLNAMNSDFTRLRGVIRGQ
ncbi:MAG: flagellar basal body rod protein FlgB [Lachnospiraceae bacterium]|jgi:flagellar basal-body rod protein FlgB|uniref:flagellar basal body rod protein FlgB n=1 Tax=Candidatus Merdisoma sp. JLR.KK011 TaxID=3114299 RepID=UPI0014351965|nr:flagellar basal body rod protein FlgB [Lachnospiraceae bacterium]MCI9251867.1 flagellar basal body rod protein FlgB [Lachnospiraceae bacterium]MCI9477698.1 flagellar basal body rod protein FlgB [Lachnospiraceae bacterium]GFI08133.1 flagellar basal body rod protein FlgB [Lachnospiraceae bacterium]